MFIVTIMYSYFMFMYFYCYVCVVFCFIIYYHVMHLYKVTTCNVGRENIVGVATRYGLNGPWIESQFIYFS